MNRYQGVTKENPRGDWMQTFSGRPFYPADPKPADVYIEDIAHSLSMQCRYGGHCERHYSVAEHSYLVSFMVPHEHALEALMHDAAEAYLIDVPRPVKALLPQYKALEEKIWLAICERFNLPPTLPACVHEADNLILHSEREQNMKTPPLDWGIADPGHRVDLKFWDQAKAEQKFLQRYRFLRLYQPS